jgi:raffinose/stachyose/melibiose transport system substrate-binding protein
MKKALLWIIISILFISIVSVFSLVGCKEEAAAEAPAEEAAAEAPAEEAAAEAPAEEAPSIESVSSLNFWLNPHLAEAFNILKEGFQAETGIKLEETVFPSPYEQAILTKWAAGERPDILNWHCMPNWLLQLRPEETLVDLSDEEWVGKTLNNYLDGATEVNGHYYSPILAEPFIWGVWYNKEIFKKAGFNMPDDIPNGYGEFLEMCKKLKDAGEVPLFAGGGDQWPLQIFPGLMWLEAFKDTDLWDELNTNQAKWTDERIISGIEKYKEVYDLGYLNSDVVTATYVDEQEAVYNGDAAMVTQGSWILQVWVDAYGDEVGDVIGFFPLSSEDNIVATQFTAGSIALYVPKTGDAAKEEAAKEFIRYCTGPKYQEFVDAAFMIPNLEGFIIPEGIPQAKKDAFSFLETNPVIPEFNMKTIPHYGPFETYLQEMLAGVKTPEEVGEALQADHETSAKDLGLEGF